MKIFRETDVFTNAADMIYVSSRIALKHDEPIHMHEFIEMTYYLGGGAIHTVNGREYEVQKGDLLLMNANLAHSHVPIDFVSYIHILVRKDYMRTSILNADNTFEVFFLSSLFEELGDDEMNSPVINFRGSDMFEVESICNTMLEEFQKRETAYETVLESYMKILLAKILRNVSSSRDKKWIGEIRGVAPEIMEYLNRNYSETLTAQDFAKNSFYTPSYFSRLFKSCYGKSIKEYITEKRMQDAVTLLLSTDLAVDKIALEVGYTNKNQFYKMFREYTGKTPAQYRKDRYRSEGKSIK